MLLWRTRASSGVKVVGTAATWLVLIAAIASAGSTQPSESEAADTPSVAASAPVSPSPTTTFVPDVTGKNWAAATSMLEEAGLTTDLIKWKSTNAAAEGTVLRQSPAAGTSVQAGDSILLLVAKPLPLIPNVVGDTLAKARHALEHAAYVVSVTKTESSRRKNTVISQSPAGGEAARPGRVVKLVVATPILGAYGNPWGYNFEGGSFIYNPPYTFCNYFPCIPSFWDGSGYVIQCTDGDFSKSGGIQGSCSYHGGNWRPLYQ